LLPADQNVKMKKTDDRVTIEDRALYRLNTWLASIKVPPHEVVLLDGCGLTRKNGVSPHALNTVLAHMAGPTLTGGYLNLLKASDHYRYKTGSMDTARSITGVVQTRGGQNLALTIMVNNHTPAIKDLRMEVDELVQLVGNITLISTKINPGPEVHTKALTESQAPVQVEVAVPLHQPHTPSRRRHRPRASTHK
jgi:D-alanyl-D-alanine carboxypeptidase